MDAARALIIVGSVLFVVSILFLVLREFSCWYFKINDRLELEKERNKHLAKISARLDEYIIQGDKQRQKAEMEQWKDKQAGPDTDR